MSETAAKPKLEFSDEQEGVLESVVEKRQNMLVTGSAGTGKSTLLRELLERCKGDLAVCASTGIAAVNVGGMTLHSWAGIGKGEGTARSIAAGLLAKKSEAYNRITRYKRLAIDEISMIGSDLFTLLDQVFRIVRNEKQAPFGGMQLVMFGDFLQLPPVGQGKDGTRFCFESPSWREARVHTRLLTKVFRQEDAAFSSALNDIRRGILSDNARQLLNSRHLQNPRVAVNDPRPELKAVIVHTHNADVDEINRGVLERIEGESKRFKATDEGRPGPLATLQKNCLAPADLELKVGAQVMLLKNLDPLAGYANGSVGTVTGFATFGGFPMVKFATGTRTIDRGKWEIKDGGKILATRTQIPLRLAWAITTHKSQGMTLDKIEVHLDRVFEDGQAYVALSRARTLDGLFIASGGRDAIRANPDAVEFYRRALEEPEPVFAPVHEQPLLLV